MTKTTETPCTCEKTSCQCGDLAASRCTCGDACVCKSECKCAKPCECSSAR